MCSSSSSFPCSVFDPCGEIKKTHPLRLLLSPPPLDRFPFFNSCSFPLRSQIWRLLILLFSSFHPWRKSSGSGSNKLFWPLLSRPLTMSWSYPNAPPTAGWQFVLSPTPVSYALPPGVDAIPEGMLRSLSGQWPIQGRTNPLFGNHGSMPVPGNNYFVHGGGGGGGGVPVEGQASSSARKKATYDGIPYPGVGFSTPPSNVSGVQSSSKQPASAELGAKQETKKPKAAVSSSSSSSSVKKRDLAKLLEGFRVTEETRKSGKTVGHKDKYYVHIETGKRLRSLEEVERFKLTGSIKKQKPIVGAMNGNAEKHGAASPATTTTT